MVQTIAGCGECNLCCILITVTELNKPAGTPCRHLVKGSEDGGCCGLHPEAGGSGQPRSCHYFFCAWLASQRLPEPYRMPPEMRPDKSGVVFGPIDPKNRKKLYLNVDPERPDSWKDKNVIHWIEHLVSQGAELVMNVDDRQVRFAQDEPTVKRHDAS